MAVTHLLTKFSANSSIQFKVIDIFPKSNMAAAAILDFQDKLFATSRHLNGVVLELCVKFGSNICYSH